MKLKTNKKIGILDGMGAFAGARFFQMTLEKIAKNNLIFPEFILNAVPVEDFFADQNKIAPALKTLSSRVVAFNQQNVTLIVMACNTAHIMHHHLASISKSLFPSIVDLVIKRALEKNNKNIGILASPVTIKTKLFENALNKVRLNPSIPNQDFQNFLEILIGKVISNTVSKDEIKQFELKTKKFIVQNQLDGLILGCTELPLVFSKEKFSDIEIFDSLDILADCVVEHVKC